MKTRHLTGLLATLALFGGACGTTNDLAGADEPPPQSATDGAAEEDEDTGAPAITAVDYPNALKKATSPALGVPRARDTIVKNLALAKAGGGESIEAAYQTALEGARGLVVEDVGPVHESVIGLLEAAVTHGVALDEASADGDLSAFVAAEVGLHRSISEALDSVDTNPDVCRLVTQYAGLARIWQEICGEGTPHGEWGRDVFRTTRTFTLEMVPTEPHRMGLVAMYAHPASARGTLPVATDLAMIHAFYAASQPHVQPPHDAALTTLASIGPADGLEGEHQAIVDWITERRAATERLISLVADGASFETMAIDAVAPLTIDLPASVAEALGGSDSCGLVAGLFC